MKISIIEPGGLNIEMAILFASKGYDVAYWSEWREAFPTGQRESVGHGFKGITRFSRISDALDHGDIIICPDTHSQDYFALARKYNKPTWGASKAERLERDRQFAKQMFKQLGMPVGPYEYGTGVEELETCLRKTEDMFVKFSGNYRGTVETKHHYDWKKTKHEWWGALLHDLGPEQDIIRWVAEKPLEHIMEVAADQLCVNGEYSTPTLVGIESKDSSYIGKVFIEVPRPLRSTNEKLSPWLRSCQAKTFFSPELMLSKDGKAFLTDPCLRTGHPVSAVQLKLYGNLCEYMIAAVLNKPLPAIKPTLQYGIALEIKSDQLDDSWLEVQFDEKRRHTVHLSCAQKRDGAYYVIPKSFIAATIVGLGDTIEAAEKEVAKTLESFSCDGMHYDLKSIQDIKQTMKKGPSCGINF